MSPSLILSLGLSSSMNTIYGSLSWRFTLLALLFSGGCPMYFPRWKEMSFEVKHCQKDNEPIKVLSTFVKVSALLFQHQYPPINPSTHPSIQIWMLITTSAQQESVSESVSEKVKQWLDYTSKRNVGAGNRKTTPTWSTLIALLLKIGPLAAARGTIGDVPVVHWSWRHCACSHPRRQPTLPSHDGSSTPLPQAEIAYPCFWNSVFWADLIAVKAFVSLVWLWTLRKVATGTAG